MNRTTKNIGNMMKRTGVTGSMILFLIVASCALFGFQPPASGEVQARRISPQFHVRLLDGTELTYKDIQGKVAVVDFWGTWCKPCLAEIPDYNIFYRDYKDKGVIFIGLAGESGSAEKVKSRSKRLNIDYPIGAPSREEFKTIGTIRAYPTTWIIAPSGMVVKEFLGVVPGKQDAIRKIVDGLLVENSL